MFFGSAEFRASMIFGSEFRASAFFGLGALAGSLGPRPRPRQLRPFNAGFGSDTPPSRSCTASAGFRV